MAVGRSARCLSVAIAVPQRFSGPYSILQPHPASGPPLCYSAATLQRDRRLASFCSAPAITITRVWSALAHVSLYMGAVSDSFRTLSLSRCTGRSMGGAGFLQSKSWKLTMTDNLILSHPAQYTRATECDDGRGGRLCTVLWPIKKSPGQYSASTRLQTQVCCSVEDKFFLLVLALRTRDVLRLARAGAEPVCMCLTGLVTAVLLSELTRRNGIMNLNQSSLNLVASGDVDSTVAG